MWKKEILIIYPAAALPASLSTKGWTLDLRSLFADTLRAPHGPVLLSLGCPLRCAYCASSVLQPRSVRRDPNLVFEETAVLYARHGIRDFAFYDDALLIEPETGLRPFLERVLRAGLPLRFHTPNGLHLRPATRELLTLMRRAGFKTLRFGYESTTPSLGTYTHHKASRERTSHTIVAAREAGFCARDIGVYVMGGLPGQTPEQMLDDIRFVTTLDVMAKPVFLSPIPGTPVFDIWLERFPDIGVDPRTHNDTFFVSRLPAWGWQTMERIRAAARGGAARD